MSMYDPDNDPYLPPRAPIGMASRKKSGTNVPDGSPWLTIWFRPRGTIRGIVDSNPSFGVIGLAILTGFGNGLTRLFQSQQNELPIAGLLVGCLIGGAIGGIIGLYISGFLIRTTGGWLGGTAGSEEVRAAVAWASVPMVVLLPFQLVAVAIMGENFSRHDGMERVEGGAMAIALLMSLAMIILGVWTCFLNIKCVAEVHRFSAWKGLGAVLLAGVVVIGVILVIVMLFFGIFAAMKAGG